MGLRTVLSGHEVSHAYTIGWPDVENGDLIAAAEAAGFQVMVTAGQNNHYQQNLAGRRLAIVVLGINNWDVIRADVAAAEVAQPGS